MLGGEVGGSWGAVGAVWCLRELLTVPLYCFSACDEFSAQINKQNYFTDCPFSLLPVLTDGL